MKKISIQLLLFFLVLLITIFTYQKYFKTQKVAKDIKKKEFSNNSEIDNKNNVIKNLEYNVNFDDKTEYLITAETSELSYEDNIEIVSMENVSAVFKDKNGSSLIVKSDEAIFNNLIYNTIFEKNVKIEYTDHLIKSEKLILNFEEKVVIIQDNIVYDGISGVGKADNIKMDLVTKDIKIFMNEPKNKVEIVSKDTKWVILKNSELNLSKIKNQF